MPSTAQTSTPTPKARDSKLTEQELIQQIRAELVSTIRFTTDETWADWQKTPIGQGYFSGTLESEIYRSFL